MTHEPAQYVGRFAPSPTGPLHFGSLVAATASYLQARSMDGRWLLRVEDIDPPREQDGATDAILRTLEGYGFEWHSNVIFQSQSEAAHNEALQSLLSRKLAYPCGCSRRDLEGVPRGPLGTIYPGTCRAGCDATETSVRLKTEDAPIAFIDGLQGRQSQNLERDSGDFIIRRRDGLIAYHLAVVVNDALEGVTEIVRGVDLMDSTPRQIWIQKMLGLATPDYLHIPVITHPNGDKLSKLTGAPGLSNEQAETALFAALVALRQDPPEALRNGSLSELWQWGTEHWNIGELKGKAAVSTDSRALAALPPGLW
ncbi:MAG: tRNA glutamyl-Q(34) synthetase GluQRS [Woeseiaceae bacterium]